MIKRVVPTINTGSTLVIPAGATGPKVASIRYDQNVATFAFNTFQNLDRTLRNQLMVAVKDNFVRVKHKPHQGYSGSSTLYLLTCLYETYVAISNADWLTKDKRF